MFTAVLFIINKCGDNLSFNEWMKKMDVIYIYNGILLIHEK